MDGSTQISSGLAGYRSVEGLGARPEEFMKMALDSARSMLLRAEAAMVAGDRQEKAKLLSSAGKLVEFMTGLTGSDRGQLSDRLATIYLYVLTAILKANAEDDIKAVTAGRVALEQLAVVWRRLFPDDLPAGEPEVVASASP